MNRQTPASDAGVAASRPVMGQEAMLAGLAVLLVHLLVRLWVAPGAYHDDAVYLALGKALASGRGWHSIYAVGAPVHLKYPPGLPALYALLWWAGGSIDRTLALVHAFHLMVSGACGALTWWVVRGRLGGTRGAAAAALVPFALVSLVDHWQLSISEGPFVAAWLGVLLLALAPPTGRRALALGLLLAFATLLRTQGWALVGGVVLAQLLSRESRRHAPVTGAAAALPVLIWAAVAASLARHGPVSTQPNESGYLAPLAAMPLPVLGRAVVTTLAINVAEYWRVLPLELGPAAIGRLIVAACAVVGAIGAWRDRWFTGALSLTFAASCALLLVLPYNQERYIIAVLPVAALLVVHGWPVAARRITPAIATNVVVAASAIVLARQVSIRDAATSADPVAEVGFEPVGRVLTRNTSWFEAVVPWVATHAPPDARILTEGAAGVWLATGRSGVAALWPAPIFMAPPQQDPRAVAVRLVADSITLVIASSPSVTASVTALEQLCPGTFRGLGDIAGLATALAVADDAGPCLARVVGPPPLP